MPVCAYYVPKVNRIKKEIDTDPFFQSVHSSKRKQNTGKCMLEKNTTIICVSSSPHPKIYTLL